MRNVLYLLARKIGAFTASRYPQLGQLFYDPEKVTVGFGDGSINGQYLISETSKQPLTNKTIDATKNTLLNVRTIGELVLTATDNRPDATFLNCDNSIISRATYSELFAIIGTQYGAPDNNTFRLPPKTVIGSLDAKTRLWIKAKP